MLFNNTMWKNDFFFKKPLILLQYKRRDLETWMLEDYIEQYIVFMWNPF